MSLQLWADNGWLRAHTTSANDVEELIEVVTRLHQITLAWLRAHHLELLHADEG